MTGDCIGNVADALVMPAVRAGTLYFRAADYGHNDDGATAVYRLVSGFQLQKRTERYDPKNRAYHKEWYLLGGNAPIEWLAETAYEVQPGNEDKEP